MLVNPHLIKIEQSGGGGGDTPTSYVTDQLIFERNCRNDVLAGAVSGIENDGSGDAIDIGLRNSCIEVCIKPLSIPKTTVDLVGFEFELDYPVDYGITISTSSEHLGSNSQFAILFYGYGGYMYICNPSNLTFSTTHTFSFSFDNTGTLTAYHNGVLFGTDSTSGDFSGYHAIEILENDYSNKNSCLIYSTRAYLKGLTASEISQNYQIDLANFTN
jgi:hypothetical protein